MTGGSVRIACADGDVGGKLEAIGVLGWAVRAKLRRERDEKFAYYLDFRTEKRKVVQALFELLHSRLDESEPVYQGRFPFPAPFLSEFFGLALRQKFSPGFLDAILRQALWSDCLPTVLETEGGLDPEVLSRLVLPVLGRLASGGGGPPPRLSAELYRELWPLVFNNLTPGDEESRQARERLQQNFLLSFQASGLHSALLAELARPVPPTGWLSPVEGESRKSAEPPVGC